MKDKSLTLVLIVLITLAAIWKSGKLQQAFSVVFL